MKTMTSDLETVHQQIKDWYNDYLLMTALARDNQRKYRRYFDGEQWTPKERAILARRKQPDTVYNRIRPKITFLIGLEDEMRVDPSVQPRNSRTHQDEANAATQALLQLDEELKVKQITSKIAENVFIEGFGGVEFSTRVETYLDQGDLIHGPSHKQRVVAQLSYIRPDRLWYDPHSQEYLFEDALYKGYTTWMDLHVAQKRWPDKHHVLMDAKAQSMGSSYDDDMGVENQWWSTKRNRIAIRTCYFQWPDEIGGYEWWQCKLTAAGFVEDPSLVPFRDETRTVEYPEGKTWCPLRLVSGYIGGDVQEGYMDANERYGLVKDMISPQDEVNKRRSKGLHYLNSEGFFYEEGAVPSIQAAKEEMAKPDGAIKLGRGALTDQRFIARQKADLGMQHLQLSQEAKMEIDNLGPHAALVSGQQGALSGRSFIAQEQSGLREVGSIFRNLRWFKEDLARCEWWCIRKWWKEERWLRVRDEADAQNYTFVRLNNQITIGERVRALMERNTTPEEALWHAGGKPAVQAYAAEQARITEQYAQLQAQVDPMQIQEEALQHFFKSPYSSHPFVENNISQLDMDLVLDVVPHSKLLETEEFREMIEAARHGVPIPPKLLVQMSSLRHKKEIIAEMEKPPDPAQVQLQQMQQQKLLEELAAKVDKLAAEAASKKAEAEKKLQEIALVAAQIKRTNAETDLKIPAEADKDWAIGMKAEQEAGKTLSETLTPTDTRESNDD